MKLKRTVILHTILYLLSYTVAASQTNNGQVTNVCSGTTMTLDTNYSSGACELTGNITAVTVLSGALGAKPYNLDIWNPGGQYTITGWPTNVVGDTSLMSGWTTLRLVWSPVRNAWITNKIGVQGVADSGASTTTTVINNAAPTERDYSTSGTVELNDQADWSIVQLTGDLSFTIGAGVAAQPKTLTFCQLSQGGYTVTAPANVRGFFLPSSAANTCSTQSFRYSTSLAAWLSMSPGAINQ